MDLNNKFVILYIEFNDKLVLLSGEKRVRDK